jgi:hypothetical protein
MAGPSASPDLATRSYQNQVPGRVIPAELWRIRGHREAYTHAKREVAGSIPVQPPINGVGSSVGERYNRPPELRRDTTHAEKGYSQGRAENCP